METLLLCTKTKWMRYLTSIVFFLFITGFCTVIQAQTRVTTDKGDYMPGETVYITGTGFGANEIVQLAIAHIEPGMPNPIHVHDAWTVQTDASGNFTETWYVDVIELNTSLYLVATGQTSHLSASTTFTDAKKQGFVSATVSGAGAMCNGVAVTLTLTVTQCDGTSGSASSYAANYQWEQNSGSGWINASGTSTNSTYSASPNVNTNYRCKITITGTYQGCGVTVGSTSTTDGVLITVNPTPSTPTASNSGPICSGSTLNLTASTIAGATYSWTGPNSFTSSAQNPSIQNFPSNATGNYSVTVTVNGCTSAAAITAATLKGKYTVNAGVDQTICPNTSVALNGSASGGPPSPTVTWTRSGTGTFGNVSSAITAYTPSAADITAGSVTLTLTASGAGNCDAFDFMVLTFHSLPAISGQPNPVSTTYGDGNVNFSVTATGTALHYQWQVNTGSGFTNIGGDNSSLTVANPTVAMSGYQYRVVVSGTCSPSVISSQVGLIVSKAASSTVVTINGGPFTYTGSAITPATVSVTGAGGLSLTPAPVYANNTNTGTASASYSYPGDANHEPSSDSKNFTIGKAASVTTVTINGGPFTYTGLTQTPATVTVTGAGGLSLTPTPVYANNINAGTASASYSYAGDANHDPSSDSKNFGINKAPSTTVVTITGGPFTYTGSAFTPATVSVTGANLSLTPTAVYSNNTNAGIATASYTFAGDVNHTGSSDSQDFTIGIRSITITPVSGQTKTYGDDDPPDFGYTVDAPGLTTGDVFFGNLVREEGENVKEDYIFYNNLFIVGADGFTKDLNYDVTFVDYINFFAITKADATVTVSGYSGVYDAAPHGATGFVVGVALDPTAVGSSLDFGLKFTDVPGGKAHWTFTGGTNYLDESGDVTITINKADATVTVSGYSGVYDAAPHGATGFVVGVALDPTAVGSSLDFGLKFTDVPGGTANWTFEGGTNYQDENGSVEIVISQADATVTVNGYTGVYDADAHGATGTVVGVTLDPKAVGSSLNLGASFTNVPGGKANWTFTGGTN